MTFPPLRSAVGTAFFGSCSASLFLLLPLPTALSPKLSFNHLDLHQYTPVSLCMCLLEQGAWMLLCSWALRFQLPWDRCNVTTATRPLIDFVLLLPDFVLVLWERRRCLAFLCEIRTVQVNVRQSPGVSVQTQAEHCNHTLAGWKMESYS